MAKSAHVEAVGLAIVILPFNFSALTKLDYHFKIYSSKGDRNADIFIARSPDQRIKRYPEIILMAYNIIGNHRRFLTLKNKDLTHTPVQVYRLEQSESLADFVLEFTTNFGGVLPLEQLFFVEHLINMCIYGINCTVLCLIKLKQLRQT